MVLNHCEKPMAIGDIKGCIDRCRELDMLSFVCANTTAEAMAIAMLHPDIINPEPSELIGTGRVIDKGYVVRTVKAIRRIDKNILIEIAAGISRPSDAQRYILAGSNAIGAASGILKSDNPYGLLDEMIGAVRKTADVKRMDSEEKGEML